MKTLTAACILDTYQCHGAAWTAAWAKRKGINIDTVLHAIGARRVHVVRT